MGAEILKDPMGTQVRYLCKAMGILCVDVNVERSQLEELRELCSQLTEALVDKQSIKSVLKLCRRLDALLQPDNEVNGDKEDVPMNSIMTDDQHRTTSEAAVGPSDFEGKILRSGKRVRSIEVSSF